jgi:hypothetical protein
MSLCHLEGTLGRIQRDLYRAWVYQLSSSSLRSAMGSRTALDESQLPSCGKLPTTKTFYPHQYQHRDRLAPLAQQAKPKVLAAHLAVCGRRGFREYDRHLLRRLRNWYSNAHRTRMHSDLLSRIDGDTQATTIPDREAAKKPTRFLWFHLPCCVLRLICSVC